MSELQQTNGNGAALMESALLHGDIEKMGPNQRLQYYLQVCASLGLNPLTKPFEFLRLNGKMQLYAKKDCTEQLRKNSKVSIEIVARETVEGCYVVTARAMDGSGRRDESIGAVPIEGLKGESRANAIMKAETKAKRRVTLSLCGLGMLDESEMDSIPGAQSVPVDLAEPKALVAAVSPPEDGEAIDPVDAKALTTMCLETLGWSRPRAVSWLKKRFGVASSLALTKTQGADALSLLTTRHGEGEEAYRAQLAELQDLGRVLPEAS